MSIQDIGKKFEGADRFKPRHFREYLISFNDLPLWSVGAFIKMLREQADGMLLDEVQISVGIKLTTCTVSEFDDAELRRFETALAEQFIDAETSLLEQYQSPSLAQLEAGYDDE